MYKLNWKTSGGRGKTSCIKKKEKKKISRSWLISTTQCYIWKERLEVDISLEGKSNSRVKREIDPTHLMNKDNVFMPCGTFFWVWEMLPKRRCLEAVSSGRFVYENRRLWSWPSNRWFRSVCAQIQYEPFMPRWTAGCRSAPHLTGGAWLFGAHPERLNNEYLLFINFLGVP